MTRAEFELVIPAIEPPQTEALIRKVTWIFLIKATM